MTTFTSSSVRSAANRPVWAILLIAGAALGCLAGCSDRGRSEGQSAVRIELHRTTSPGVVASAPLLAELQRNFDLATRGASDVQTQMIAVPRQNSAGIECNPARISRAASNFRIVLPNRAAERKGAFAVIVPDGSLRIVYFAYGGDVGTEDIIIPSKIIDWESARTRNIFDVDAKQFDSLRPGKEVPEHLFGNAGIYQFAVVNAVDRSLLAVNKTAFRVVAGCVVEWHP